MKTPLRQAKRYWNRFKYLFFQFYRRDFIRVNSQDILDSIIISNFLIFLSSLIHIIFVDQYILDESIRWRVIAYRVSFPLVAFIGYRFLKLKSTLVRVHFGNYTTFGLCAILLLHVPLMNSDPANYLHYLVGSSLLLLGISILLWVEPIRITYISLGYILILIPIAARISVNLNENPHTFNQSLLNVVVIIIIGFVANTMINYWRFEDFRSNERLRRTLKNLKITNEKIRTLSHQDSLTSVFNRRFLMEAFDQRSKDSIQSGYSFGLIILDLDYLKKINDKYGHIQGDQVIIKFADTINSLTRPGDITARIGGDEFCILTKKIDSDMLYSLAETIRLKIESLELKVYDRPNEKHKVSTSIGAILVEPGQNVRFDSLYHQIDEALYTAKTEGRNRVILIQRDKA